MDFKTYFLSLSEEQKLALANSGETSVGHLRNIAYGQKPCREKLAITIDRESMGIVTCEILRPDVDWAYLRGTSIAALPVIPECGASDPRHGERRHPDQRQSFDRRAGEA